MGRKIVPAALQVEMGLELESRSTKEPELATSRAPTTTKTTKIHITALQRYMASQDE
jgi:hypothetical protein